MASSTNNSDPPARADVDDATPLRHFERSLPMALMRARESIMSQFRPVLAEHDLTEQQWRVLRALSANSGPCSVGRIAEQTFLLGPSLSRMLTSMSERGLVTRRAHPDDARRSEIAISTAGRALVDEIAPRSEAVYQRISDALSGPDLDVLYELLERTADIE